MDNQADTFTYPGFELPASGVQFRPYPAAVGRDVHYVSYDTEADTKACRAAKVTVAEDEQGRVGLCVYHPNGLEFLTAVEAHHIDEPKAEPGVSGREPGTWHWPEQA